MSSNGGEVVKISWRNVTVKLGDLKPWGGNPKTSTKKDAKILLRSWEELGQFQAIAIGPDGSVYDGHQRLSALLTVHGPDYTIEARQSSVNLSDEARRKIALYSRQIGAWDWETLANWQPAELMEAGFDQDLLRDWKRDTSALGNFLGSEKKLVGGEEEIIEQYSIILMCETEQEQIILLDRLTSEGIKCRALIS